MLAGPAHLITVGKTSAEKRLLRADTVWEAKSPRTARNSTIQLGRSGEEESLPCCPHALPPLTEYGLHSKSFKTFLTFHVSFVLKHKLVS